MQPVYQRQVKISQQDQAALAGQIADDPPARDESFHGTYVEAERTNEADAAAVLHYTLKLLTGQWKCSILHQLMPGPARFTALRRSLHGITSKALTSQLRELEAERFVERRVYAEVPVKVEYAITPRGQSIEPVLRTLLTWGRSQYLQS